MGRLSSNDCRDISQQYREYRQIEETDYSELERMERIEVSYDVLYGECGRGLGTWQPFIKRDRVNPPQRTNNVTTRRCIDIPVYMRSIVGTTRLSSKPVPLSSDPDPMQYNPLIHYDWDTDVLGIGDYDD